MQLDEIAQSANPYAAALHRARQLVKAFRITDKELRQMERDIAIEKAGTWEKADRVLKFMRDHNISIEDIIDSMPTHRHPVTGEEWNGKGAQPAWVRRALLSEGYRPGDLRTEVYFRAAHQGDRWRFR